MLCPFVRSTILALATLVLVGSAWAQTPTLITPTTLDARTFVVVAPDLAYFVGTDSVHGQEIWRTDGTSAGTYLFEDTTPGAGSRT